MLREPYYLETEAMGRVEEIDMLFQSVLARFFAIPARKPASGAVTFAQMRVLWILEMKGTAALGEVARFLGISNSSATELVDRLVRGGYVRREERPDDRRQLLLSLRPKGKAMLADFARRRRERFEKLVRVMKDGDIDRMAAALGTVNSLLARWNNGGSRT